MVKYMTLCRVCGRLVRGTRKGKPVRHSPKDPLGQGGIGKICVGSYYQGARKEGT